MSTTTPSRPSFAASPAGGWRGELHRTIERNPYVPHAPSPRQGAFLAYPTLEVGYGGAAGGGKSVALLMAALQYVDTPGYNALLIRRTFADLNLPDALIPMSHEWLAATDARWNGQDHRWTFPSGATLTFGYCESERDIYRYQGAALAFCVDGDTPVQMADGSTKPMRAIQVGDMVRTLEGARRVTRTHVTRKPAVRATICVGDRIIGQQIQASDHRLLTRDGWASRDTCDGVRPCETSESTGRLVACRCEGPSSPTCRSGERLRGVARTGRRRTSEPTRSPQDHQSGLACVAGEAQPDRESGDGSPECRSRETWRQASDSRTSTLQPLARGRSGQAGRLPSPSRGGEGVHGRASRTGCRDGCSSCDRRCGGRARRRLEGVLVCLPRQADAGRRNPTDCVGDGPARTQRYSHGRTAFAHPYSSGVRQTTDRLFEASASFESLGIRELYDITVESASHYVTQFGLVNSNCGWDELTQFPERPYRYLFSRLRKRKGLPVPLRIRAGFNPGGIGHEWVRARFVDGQNDRRRFVPAKLEDNPHLDREAYEESLQQLDTVTRAQLRNGDWDVRPEGNLFKRSWFEGQIVDTLPPMVQTVRFWDLAATEEGPGIDPDFTAGVKMGMDAGGTFYVLDAEEFRETPHKRNERIREIAGRDGRGVDVCIEQEPGSSGKSVIDQFVRQVLTGFPVRGVRSTGDKITRAKPFSAATENGLVRMLRGAWNGWFIERLTSFGLAGVHDDTADAAAGAHRFLTQNEEPWDEESLREVFTGPGESLDGRTKHRPFADRH